MKSNNLTMEDRLKKLYASLGLNVGAKSSNLAMIKSSFQSSIFTCLSSSFIKTLTFKRIFYHFRNFIISLPACK
jgi:hypothetical protein